MTFPVGALPDQGTLQQSFVPHKSVVFTSGGSDLDLTDPASGCVPCAFEVYCTSTGNIVAQLAGDSATRTYPVTQGQVLQGAFTLIKSTSTANGICRQ